MHQSKHKFYLPEYHEFEFIASVPIENLCEGPQLDWVNAVNNVEYWLNNRIGQHYSYWAWADAKQSMKAAVAFKWDKHRVLFLLKWGVSD